MGKPTGFIEWDRALPDRRDVKRRLGDYKELPVVSPAGHTEKQAGRCMDCGIPFCQQGCPLGNHIPDWNDLVYRGRWREAHESLAATNNFGEFTGRLCPAPCEAACVLAIDGAPVTIEEVEKQIVERAFAEGWVKPVKPPAPTGHRVAIVGSGPAGLAAAAQLASVGHRVTVFEAADRVGGLLRYGIPDFKLEKWVIDRRLGLLEAAGVRFVTGCRVGESLPWDRLRRDHDAVLVATGAERPRDLDVPGRELPGVVFAMDYLTRQNRLVAGDGDAAPELDAAGKRVVILGGGDTGSDCLGTALRQGASDVTQIELFPEPPPGRGPGNPWPQWPLVFRTSSSQEEGGERSFALLTRAVEGSGRAQRLRVVEVAARPGPGGRVTLEEQAGSERVLDADLVILAMGFVGPDTESMNQLGLDLDPRGNLAATDHATSVPGVYAAGDARRGQSLIVWAIAEGREAARAMDAYLRGSEPQLPTRGRDEPFGGR